MSRSVNYPGRADVRSAAIRKAALLLTACSPLLACGTASTPLPTYSPPHYSDYRPPAPVVAPAPAPLPSSPAADEGGDYVSTGLQLLPLLNLVPAKRPASSAGAPVPGNALASTASKLRDAPATAEAAAVASDGAATAARFGFPQAVRRFFTGLGGRSVVRAGTALAGEEIAGTASTAAESAFGLRVILRVLCIPLMALLFLYRFVLS